MSCGLARFRLVMSFIYLSVNLYISPFNFLMDMSCFSVFLCMYEEKVQHP